MGMLFPSKLAARKYPGEQKQRLINRLRPSVLLILLIVFALIIIIQVLGHYSVIDPALERIFPIDIDKSIVTFSSLLALSFTIKNFALSVRPILSYEYIIAKKSQMSLVGDGDVFQVKLINAGPGVGIVTDAYYCLQLYGKSPEIKTNDPNKVVRLLESANLIRYLNYEIFIPRPGYSFASKEERPFFEISPNDARKIVRLDVRIRLSSVLGDEYEKWFFCIPREKGLSLPVGVY